MVGGVSDQGIGTGAGSSGRSTTDLRVQAAGQTMAHLPVVKD